MTNNRGIPTSAFSRRTFLGSAAAGATGLALGFPSPALSQGASLKVGLMLPSSGTFAKLGQFIDNGFSLYVEQKGGMLGGRPVEFIRLDDESKPETATDNMNRLVGRDKVDFVVGTVHSGVAMAMVKVARDTGVPLIIPNAGADEATGPLCAPTISSAPPSPTGRCRSLWARSCTMSAIAMSSASPGAMRQVSRWPRALPRASPRPAVRWWKN